MSESSESAQSVVIDVETYSLEVEGEPINVAFDNLKLAVVS